jgi:hypothetical protein
MGDRVSTPGMDKYCFPYNSTSRPFPSLKMSLSQHMLKAGSAGIKRHGSYADNALCSMSR